MFSNSDYELCAKAIFSTLSFPNCKEGFFIDRYAHYYHFSLVNTMSSSDHVAFRDQAASAKGTLPLGLHLEKMNYHSWMLPYVSYHGWCHHMHLIGHSQLLPSKATRLDRHLVR